MAQKSIQIADKPTLDAAKALLEDSDVGLAAIKEAVSSGAASGSAGGLQIGKIVDEQVSGCVSESTLPYYFYNGSAAVLNNEIHILGGSGDGETKHYKYNGTSWKSVSTLPYEFYQGSAVVYNNDIHILGGSSGGNGTKHSLVRPDSRHIATMLPKGVHILLSDNEDIVYASNAKRISSNIAEVTDTGYVELLVAFTDADNIKGYLTFY